MLHHLQLRAVNDLIIDGHLETLVIDNQNTNAAAAIVEGLGQASEKVALVKNRETLLDVASLGHGNDATVLTDIKDTVLLEDRAKHVLNNDRRRGVGDEAGLLIELLGEQVNTEVAVLASLGGGGDADDLARAALEDQEIANADVVAGDGDGVGRSHLAGFCNLDVLDERRPGGRTEVRYSDRSWGGSGGRRVRAGGSRSRGRRGELLLNYNFLTDVVVLGALVRVLVRVVVAVTVNGVNDVIGDLVSSFGDTVTKRMVVTVFVVISHITLVLLGGVDSGSSSGLYSNLFPRRVTAVNGVNLTALGVGVVLRSEGLLAVVGGLVLGGLGAEIVALGGVTS